MKDIDELYGIAFGCPFFDRQNDCPVKEIEHFSIKEKVNWINRLSQHEKHKLMEKHQDCSKKRDLIELVR